jgi:hypothetical protein
VACSCDHSGELSVFVKGERVKALQAKLWRSESCASEGTSDGCTVKCCPRVIWVTVALSLRNWVTHSPQTCQLTKGTDGRGRAFRAVAA